MKKLAAALSCTALFVGLSARPASADQFQYSFSGADTGSGTLTAGLVPGTTNQYLITDVTGTLNGVAISGLIAKGGFPTIGAPNDNLLYYTIGSQTGAAPYIDIQGYSFTVTGGAQYNLYFGSFGNGFPTGYNLTYGANLDFNDLLSSFTLTDLSAPSGPGSAPTPEPSSLMLLGTGALGLIGAARRRFSSAV